MEPIAASELWSHVPIMRVGEKNQKTGDDVVVLFIFWMGWGGLVVVSGA